jgi:hypothetical protein
MEWGTGELLFTGSGVSFPARMETVGLGMAAHPVYLEVEIKKTMVQGQPRRKVSKTPSQPVSWVWW